MSWNLTFDFFEKILSVTLHVSVWVEIHSNLPLPLLRQSRSTWACELKFVKNFTKIANTPSRSTWACELKFIDNGSIVVTEVSRSTWACELKSLSTLYTLILPCHAPRERVSWNLLWLQVRLFVTCHAPHERVGQFSIQRRTYRYWIIQITAWLRSGGIFIPKYYTFFMCFSSNPPIHTPKFVQTNDL